MDNLFPRLVWSPPSLSPLAFKNNKTLEVVEIQRFYEYSLFVRHFFFLNDDIDLKYCLTILEVFYVKAIP